ncbi:MAG: hypothetical protein CUN55_05400 [Phototrophicales bacterium]|nr:MAG: hypothetical protein CUN55_05400 [Phototrophicales bacterium]
MTNRGYSENQHLSRTRQQLRGFVAVWLGITILVSVATFVGIYVGTGKFETATASNDGAVIVIAQEDNAETTTIIEETSASVEPTTNDVKVVEEAPAPNTEQRIAEESSSTRNITENIPPSAPLSPSRQDPTPAYTPTIPPRQETKFDLGIQVVPAFGNDRDRMAGYMDAAANQLKLNWVKLQVRWEFAEPQPGIYDWEALGYDLFFQEATDKNLKVLVSIVSTPDWARQPGVNLEQHGPPANNQDFANFVAALLQRYPGQIHAVEVWNEMNLAREWTSTNGLSAADYVAMLATVSEVIRFLDPNIIIISGALSPTGVNDGVVAIDDFVYTDQLIANGLLNYIDCYGAHHNGYNIGPNVPFDRVPNDPTASFRGPFDNPNHSWSFYTTLNTYATKIANAGSNIPLCVTEFGWAVTEDFDLSSVGGAIPNFEFANDNTLEEQRIFTVEAIELMEEWGFVRLAIIWNLNYGAEAAWDLSRPYRDNMPYSLIRPNYIPAPVWAYIADMNFRGRP